MNTLIALLGGTFDPIHIGHLRAALEARAALNADVVRLLPNADPPHRQTPKVSARQRAELCAAAIEGLPGLELDLRELARQGPSYTVETLRELRAELGGEVSLALLMGADAFVGLPTWHQWARIPDLAHLVVLNRPDSPTHLPPVLETELARRGTAEASDLRRTPAGRILRLEIPPLQISATELRAKLAAGSEVRFLVPDAVRDRILSEGWYRARGA